MGFAQTQEELGNLPESWCFQGLLQLLWTSVPVPWGPWSQGESCSGASHVLRVVGTLQRGPVVQRHPQNSTCPATTVVGRALEELSTAVVLQPGAEPALLLLRALRTVKLGVQWVTVAPSKEQHGLEMISGVRRRMRRERGWRVEEMGWWKSEATWLFSLCALGHHQALELERLQRGKESLLVCFKLKCNTKKYPIEEV